MKNLTAIVLVSISLFSCKQEKTKTVVNPETGKTETVVIPENAENMDTVPKADYAIKDSAGVYTQKFNLEKGQTYPFVSYQKNVTLMTDPSGKSLTGTQETTDEMSFKVNDMVNGIYDITINLSAKRIASSSNGQTKVVDTKLSAPAAAELKSVWSINKAMTGTTLNMKMDSEGKIISITGFEPIYKKVEAAVASSIKDPKQKAQFSAGLKQSFNEKSISEQFSKNLLLLPKNGVKIGQSWTKSENLSPDGKLKLTTTYTLAKVENGVAEIRTKGGVPLKSDKMTQQGITQTMSIEGSQSGLLKYDAITGWILTGTENMTTMQKETVSDGKKSQSMTQKSTITASVNPSYK